MRWAVDLPGLTGLRTALWPALSPLDNPLADCRVEGV